MAYVLVNLAGLLSDMSLAGFPIGFSGGDGRLQPLAGVGVAALVVGGPEVRAAVADRLPAPRTLL
jgi:hypothetical protein